MAQTPLALRHERARSGEAISFIAIDLEILEIDLENLEIDSKNLEIDSSNLEIDGFGGEIHIGRRRAVDQPPAHVLSIFSTVFRRM